jgi:transposase
MKERTRNEVIRLFYSRTSQRQIAKLVGISRKSVGKIIDVHQNQRAGISGSERSQRSSLLDSFEERITELVERYPDITAVRLHEELCHSGFTGGYTIVKDRLRQVRPKPLKPFVERFETAPGLQAQMDYSMYRIDFTADGPRKVYAFGLILAFSRRLYLRFVETQDLHTTLREHHRAFDYFQGVPATCLYDNMKVVVSRFDGSMPIFNTRFLAFATHYGFQPLLCRPARPQTKGKIERPFHFIEKNLLNARRFSDLDNLNEVTAQWLAEVNDTRVHRTTGQRPIDRFQQERPQLLALPHKPYDTTELLYRTVNSEGYVAYLQNFYSVPWQRAGEFVPVRITEKELFVYAPNIKKIAQHELFARSVSDKKAQNPSHRPPHSIKQRVEVLRKRFSEFGSLGERFFDELIRDRRFGKDEALRILTLRAIYHFDDLKAALERATRYRAFSLSAIERILAAQAQPITTLEALTESARQSIDELLRKPSVPARPASEYQQLLDGTDDDESP